MFFTQVKNNIFLLSLLNVKPWRVLRDPLSRLVPWQVVRAAAGVNEHGVEELAPAHLGIK